MTRKSFHVSVTREIVALICGTILLLVALWFLSFKHGKPTASEISASAVSSPVQAPKSNETARSTESAIAQARAAIIAADADQQPAKAQPTATPQPDHTPNPEPPLAPQPAPQIQRDAKFGTSRIRFAELLDRKGVRLATDVVYVRNSGRLVIFQPETGPAISFSADQLHPQALEYVGVDLHAATQAEKERQTSKAQRARAAQKPKAARAASSRKRAEAASKAAANRTESEIEAKQDDVFDLRMLARERERAAINYSHATIGDRNRAKRDGISRWLTVSVADIRVKQATPT
jgi:hypothetical protein